MDLIVERHSLLRPTARASGLEIFVRSSLTYLISFAWGTGD